MAYSDVNKKINREDGFTLQQKRALREILTQVYADSAADLAAQEEVYFPAAVAANQAGAAFQAAAETYEVTHEQQGTRITTRVVVDLTGLKCGGTANDAIGPDGAAAVVFKWTAAECGDVLKSITLNTWETPAGGDTDIDVAFSATGTTNEDAALTSSTVALNSGGIQAFDSDAVALTDLVAKPFIYLTGATGGDAAYTAGKVEFVIEGMFNS